MSDLYRCEGLFVGMLDPDEQRDFSAAVKDGLAYSSYEGAAGFMGLAKVRFYPQRESADGG